MCIFNLLIICLLIFFFFSKSYVVDLFIMHDGVHIFVFDIISVRNMFNTSHLDSSDSILANFFFLLYNFVHELRLNF